MPDQAIVGYAIRPVADAASRRPGAHREQTSDARYGLRSDTHLLPRLDGLTRADVRTSLDPREQRVDRAVALVWVRDRVRNSERWRRGGRFGQEQGSEAAVLDVEPRARRGARRRG